jgi:DNA-binding response OmpR family regulator
MEKKSILLLEDDLELGETLQELLESEGYSVTLVDDGNKALDSSYESKFDLYIFDINVPEINGLELLNSLREADDGTPAIFISALVDIESISRGFEVGADDYIKKPFFPQELLIRVNAKFTSKSKAIQYKHIEYDPINNMVKKSGKIISLGEVQMSLLKAFLHNVGTVVDREILLDCLEHPSSTALRVAINKLKTTLELDIKNVRGVGYSIE